MKIKLPSFSQKQRKQQPEPQKLQLDNKILKQIVDELTIIRTIKQQQLKDEQAPPTGRIGTTVGKIKSIVSRLQIAKPTNVAAPSKKEKTPLVGKLALAGGAIGLLATVSPFFKGFIVEIIRQTFDLVAGIMPEPVKKLVNLFTKDEQNPVKQTESFKLDIQRADEEYAGEVVKEELSEEKQIASGQKTIESEAKKAQEAVDRASEQREPQERTFQTPSSVSPEAPSEGPPPTSQVAPTPAAKPQPSVTQQPQKQEKPVSDNAALGLVKTKLGADEQSWDIFRNTVAGIESSGRYDVYGGAGNHYDGRYQLGRDAKIDGAKVAGVPNPGHSKDPNDPARASYRMNPGLQELIFAGYTIANHNYLKKLKEYEEKSLAGKLQVLGYAHNQGMGGAEQWLKTGVVGTDGFGTKGTKYTDALRIAFINAGLTGEKQIAATTPSTGTAVAATSADVVAAKKEEDARKKVYRRDVLIARSQTTAVG